MAVELMMNLDSVLSETTSGHEEDTAKCIPKRKRSKRPHQQQQQTEEEYLALCLVMLARGSPASCDNIPLNFSVGYGRGKSTADQKSSNSSSSKKAMKIEYTCKVCGKGFGSFQALGGHKASHRVKQQQQQQQEEEEELVNSSLSHSPAALSTSASANSSVVSIRLHRCSICSKTFASGQALGGHKRCHYQGTIGGGGGGGGGGGSGVTSATSLGSGGFRVFDLDLNVPARPEFRLVVEEEEVQSPLAFKKPRFLIPAA